MEVDDFSSLLRIEVIDPGQTVHKRSGLRCAVCLQSFPSSSKLTARLPECLHGVCQTCHDLATSDGSSVFCVMCQVRSVSPNPNYGELLSREPYRVNIPTTAISTSMPNEKHEIIKTQLAKMHHLEEAVYKPLGKHFERILLRLKNGLDKKIQTVEARFEEIVDDLGKQKKKIVKSLKQNSKANQAMIETKKREVDNERVQLREWRRRHQEKLNAGGRGRSSDIVINSFLGEVDSFQRKARKTSTTHSVTEFTEPEVCTDLEKEGSIKNAAEKLVTLRETNHQIKSRVGTPTSSIDNTSSVVLSSISRSGSDEKRSSQQSGQTSRRRPTSLGVPIQRTQSLSPHRRCISASPISPRDVRSAADGCEIPDANFLPDITNQTSPTGGLTLQLSGSRRRRQPVPPGENDAGNMDLRSNQHVSQASPTNQTPNSVRRTLPSISQVLRRKVSSQSGQVKYQTFLRDDLKLERPCGVCFLGNGNDVKDVVAVADCGLGKIIHVGLDRQVTRALVVWEDDGESVKGHGVFDVTICAGGCLAVSDSHKKEVIIFEGARRLHSLHLPAKTDPRGVTSHGNRIFICDQGNHCIQMLDLHDKNDIAPRATAIALARPNEDAMVFPYFLAVDRTGERILVSDYGNGALILARTDNAHPPVRVKLEAPSTSRIDQPCQAANIDIRPTGVAWLPEGRGAVVADQIGHRLVVVDEELKMIGSFGRQGCGEGEFLFPHGIAFISNSILSVCDMNNARIQFIELASILASIT